MKFEEPLKQHLERVFRDGQVSRRERKALTELLEACQFRPETLIRARELAFQMAESRMNAHNFAPVHRCLEEVIQIIEMVWSSSVPSVARVGFSPANECAAILLELLFGTQSSVDICVFTITDDRIRKALLDTFHRRVSIRIITDDEKIHDRGSDILHLVEAGIPVKVDYTEEHMHHKFAIFDRHTVLTGSYNWTRSGAQHNYENVLVTNDRRIVSRYQKEFDRLWKRFGAFRLPE
ncbi:MAG: hypothetical protein D6681_06520 [Calditrichaeota bacterium]|nr:MAG: hypothetical protein D6681_06520 [Calditrichota bacterium]